MSFQIKMDAKARASARFFARVVEELQKAMTEERAGSKLTQQKVATALGVNRSVVNRRLLGRDNLTVKTIGELAWALGRVPTFSLEKPARIGANETVRPSAVTTSAPPIAVAAETGCVATPIIRL